MKKPASVIPLVFATCTVLGQNHGNTGTPDAANAFQETVLPFFAKTCYSCHNAKTSGGGLDLKLYTTPDAILKDRDKFEVVLQKLLSGQMPPRSRPRPDAGELDRVEKWLQREFDRADAAINRNPGRGTSAP